MQQKKDRLFPFLNRKHWPRLKFYSMLRSIKYHGPTIWEPVDDTLWLSSILFRKCY